MASSSKKKRLYTAAAFIIIMSAVVFIQFKDRLVSHSATLYGESTDQLLFKADSSLGNNPAMAESYALAALRRSFSTAQPKKMARAWIVLGKLERQRGENKKAITLFKRAEQTATENALITELCAAKICIGEVVYDRGDYDSALTYFIDVEKLALNHNLDSVRSYSLLYLGKYNETKGNFEKAKQYYALAISISRKYEDHEQLVSLLLSRGKNDLSDGRLNLALESYLEAFQLSRQFNNRLLYGEVCSHLGGLYLQMDEYQKALDYDKKALANRSGMNNPDGIAKSYNNIGRAYSELKQPDSALYYFGQSLAYCNKIDYQKGKVKALTNTGRIMMEQKKNSEAFKYLGEAYLISNRLGYGVGIAESSLAMADYFRGTLQIGKAIDYYRLSLKKIKGTGYDEILEGIYRGLSICYQLKGAYQQALQNHIELLAIEKKLLNVENNRQLALLNISFDSELTDRDNRMLRADNEVKELLIKRKNGMMWLAVAGLGFTLILCFAIYNKLYVNRKANKKLRELNAKTAVQNHALAALNRELENVNHEKDKLFTIISHELRNPLYWFQNLAEVLSKNFRRMSPDKVQKSLSSLDESAKNAFHLMDNLLQWSRSKLNLIHPKKTRHELFLLVSDTIDMYRTIMVHRELSIFNDIPEDIFVYADADLMGCVIRNLVSNAVKYTPARGTIWIKSRIHEGYVTVLVSDSGAGIISENLVRVFESEVTSMPGLLEEKGSGLGLKLCKEFVELNGGRIWADNLADSGTQFCFTLPVVAGIHINDNQMELSIVKKHVTSEEYEITL